MLVSDQLETSLNSALKWDATATETEVLHPIRKLACRNRT